MNISEAKVYNFTFMAEGTNYNFSIVATSRSEACEKLERALLNIVEELKVELTRPQPSRQSN